MECKKVFDDAAKIINDVQKSEIDNSEKISKIINSLLEMHDKYVKEGKTQKAKDILRIIRKIQSERWKNNKEELIEIFEKEGISLDDVLKEN